MDTRFSFIMEGTLFFHYNIQLKYALFYNDISILVSKIIISLQIHNQIKKESCVIITILWYRQVTFHQID